MKKTSFDKALLALDCIFNFLQMLLSEMKRPILRLPLTEALRHVNSVRAHIKNAWDEYTSLQADRQLQIDSYEETCRRLKIDVEEQRRLRIEQEDSYKSQVQFYKDQMNERPYRYISMPPLTDAEETQAVTNMILAIKAYRERMREQHGVSDMRVDLKACKDHVEQWMPARGYTRVSPYVPGGPLWTK